MRPFVNNDLSRTAYNLYRFFKWAILAHHLSHMADKPMKRYIFASDFDQTFTFNDPGYVPAELVGIPTAEFERKAKGLAAPCYAIKA